MARRERLKELFSAAVGYVRKNPDEIVNVAVNAAGLRFGVPLAALRYFVEQAQGKKVPKDLELATSPPALRLGGTVNAMGTSLRATAALRIERVSLAPDSLQVTVRVNDVSLKVVGESDSPVATLVKSGALDLSNVGNLVKVIPKRPAAIVDASGDRVVIDLMQVPAIAQNAKLRRALEVLTPLVGIRAVETDDDHLYVALRATPSGIGRALVALRR